MFNITQEEFNDIRKYIKDNYGINLNDEKKSLVYSRLKPILNENGFKNFKQYYDYLVSDKTGHAAITFIDKITTNHTFFMREVDHFYYLRDKVLPYFENNIKDYDLRVWCAGCSSGEESYTIEMILNDYFKTKNNNWNIDLLATDISTQVLNKAFRGIYTNEQISSLPDKWRLKYFKKYDENNCCITDEIKEKVIYRKFNLMESKFCFKKKFHIIFCRNVMIYFDAETREKLVKKFYDISAEGAYLFIGHSESLSNTDVKYKYIMPAIYRKI